MLEQDDNRIEHNRMTVKKNIKSKNYALEIKTKTQTFKIFWHWEKDEKFSQ